MVQILPQFDPGAQIGQALGGGLGELLGQKAREQRIKGSMSEALAMLKPQAMLDQQGQPMLDEQGRPRMTEPNMLDAIASLVPVLSQTPGGMQALGEVSPLLERAMFRQARQQKVGAPRGGPGAPTEEPGTQVPDRPESIEQKTDRYYAEELEVTPNPEQARTNAIQRVNLESQEQDRRARQEQQILGEFDKNAQESWGADVDSSYVTALRDDYAQMRKKGISPDKAWQDINREGRAIQMEGQRLVAESPRRPFMSYDTAELRGTLRQMLPKSIARDPELARAKIMNTSGMGEGEASLTVKPGSEKFNQFTTQLAKRHGKFEKDALAVSPVGEVSARKRKAHEDKQREFLEKFVRNDFDPQVDSLLGLRHEVVPYGISDAVFLDVVNDIYPDPANNENLSQFNRNEASRLAQPSKPGLLEIFSGWLKSTQEPARRFGAGLRGKR